MKVYLDNCVLSRPFDDQSQERIRLETEAIVLLLARLERKEWIWLGSQVLDIEIDQLPDFEQQLRLRQVVEFVNQSIPIGEKEVERANELQKMGFIGFDAVHLACAESGKPFELDEGDDLMNIQTMTPQQIRVAGLEVLARELGLVGMIRFMQQFEMGQGNYSVDRHKWLDKYMVEDIARMVQEKNKVYRPSRKKK